MSAANFFQFVALIAVLAVTVFPLGRYIAKVFGSEPDGRAPGDRVLRSRRATGVPAAADRSRGRADVEDVRAEPDRVQPRVVRRAVRHPAPAEPPAVQPDAASGAVSPHLSFDTAVSFVTNTNWQSYGGENTMSHLTQIGGLLVQHFASAAVGMAVVVALHPGHRPQPHVADLGNFWVDLVRGTTRILLPMAIVFAIDPR